MSDQAPESPDRGQADQQIRDGMAQHAANVRDSAAPPEDGQDEQLGAQIAAGGSGATETDIPQLMAYIKAMSARVEALEAEKRQSGSNPLIATVAALRDLVKAHAASSTTGADHSEVLGLADDLADAADNAVKSGGLEHVKSIGAKIEAALRRVHPGPGENASYRQAVDFAGPHLADAMDGFTGPEPTSAAAVGSSRPPAKVISGNVTG